MTPEFVIEAICDDKRHSRGKIRVVAKFGRFTRASGLGDLQVYPGSGSRWLIWRPDAERWSFTAWDSKIVDAHRRYDEPEKCATYTWSCPMCGGTLKCREDVLHQLLEGTYQVLVRDGAAPGEAWRVPLKGLRRVLRSTRPTP